MRALAHTLPLRLLFCVLLPLALAPSAAAQTAFPLADELKVSVGGMLHADARLLPQGADGAVASRFLLRRARLLVRAEAGGRFRFIVEPDFGGGSARLADAWIEADLVHGVRARAGRFRTPFGLEELRSSNALWFAERGYSNALVPSRDLGVMLHGVWAQGRIEAAAGVFNGVPDGSSERGEPSSAKDVAARVMVRPFSGPLGGLGAGLAATTGAEHGTAALPLIPSFTTLGGRPITSFGDEGFADGRRTRLSPQLLFFAGPFGLIGEYTHTQQRIRTPASHHRVLRHKSWQGAVAWNLTGEPQGYGQLKPARPVTAGGPGAFEVAARVHGLILDDHAYVHQVTSWSAGVNWYTTDYTRLVLSLDRTWFPREDFDPETFVVLRAQFKL